MSVNAKCTPQFDSQGTQVSPPPLPRGKQTQIKMDRISPGESSLFRNQKPLSSHYIFYLGKKHGTGKATLIFKCDRFHNKCDQQGSSY